MHNSFYFNPLNNDLGGKTDKFLTHSTRLGLTYDTDDSESLDFRLGWRFLTPSYQIADGVELRPPVGKYGDWSEAQFAYSVLFVEEAEVFIPRIQLEAGLGHLGPKGAREMQVGLHKEIGNSWQHLTWVDQERGITSGAGVELGLASAGQKMEVLGSTHFFYMGYGVSSNPIMFQQFVKFNLVSKWSDHLGASIEAKYVRQIASLILPDLTPNRSELALGLLLSEWYKPTVTWVSAYFQNDPVGQFYFDLININWPL